MAVEGEGALDRQRVASLGAHTLLAKVTVNGLGLVASVLIARALGPEGRGHYILPVSLATIAFQLGGLGSWAAQYRLWAQRKARKRAFVTNGLFLSLALGALSAGLAWLAFAVWRESFFEGVVPLDLVIVTAALPLLLHSMLASSLLILERNLPLTNMASVLGAIVQTAGIATLFITGRLTVVGVLLLWVVSVAVPWLVMLSGVLRIARPQRSIPWPLIVSHLRLGIQYVPWILFLHLNLRIDVFFLARYRGLDAVGIYSIAVLVAEVIWLITDSLGLAVSGQQANEPEEVAIDVTLRAIRMTFLLAALAGIVIGVGGYLGIGVVYGREFSPAAPIVWILLPATLAMAQWRIVGNVLLRFAAPTVLPGIAISGLVVNIVANMILIPALGIAGAALASLLSYACGAILAIVLFRRRYAIPLGRLIPSREDAQRLLGELLGIIQSRSRRAPTPSQDQ